MIIMIDNEKKGINNKMNSSNVFFRLARCQRKTNGVAKTVRNSSKVQEVESVMKTIFVIQLMCRL